MLLWTIQVSEQVDGVWLPFEGCGDFFANQLEACARLAAWLRDPTKRPDDRERLRLRVVCYQMIAVDQTVSGTETDYLPSPTRRVA